MLTDQQISDLKDKYPGQELASVEVDETTDLVFKKPARMEYNRWFNTREGDKSGAALQLAAACLVFPAYEQMVSALDKKPALLMQEGGIQSAILLLAGIGDEVRKPKKL